MLSKIIAIATFHAMALAIIAADETLRTVVRERINRSKLARGYAR
jgi:hypothetical protein